MTDRFVVVPAAYVYLLREGGLGTEVLLQLRQNTGYMDGRWAAAAAGHVERGETAYDAARREALEELGIDDLDLVFELTMQRTQGADPIDERVDFFFTARSWQGEPRIIEPHKCAALRWWPLGDVPEGVVPHEGLALASLGSGVRYETYGFGGTPGREGAVTMDDKLGPMPDPVIEPPEDNPGGADAINDDPPFSGDEPAVLGHDLHPDDNPGVEDRIPEAVGQPEDKQQENEGDGASEPEKEDPA